MWQTKGDVSGSIWPGGAPPASAQPTAAVYQALRLEQPSEAAVQNATARAKTAQLLYNAMRGLPYISNEYLAALAAGEVPAPRMMTPQTLAALANDTFLSDNFFALLEAAGLYPTSFLAEAARFQPKGAQATPSFI
jgi:hypothetical protein